jgi:uncharacterized membrane protein
VTWVAPTDADRRGFRHAFKVTRVRNNLERPMTRFDFNRRHIANHLHDARRDLKTASVNLWRARRIGYGEIHQRHFERLVLVQLDRIWDLQERLNEIGHD